MSETILDDTSEPIQIELDEDVVKGLRRLKNTFGFPVSSMVSESLRPFINTFLPLADLYEQGKLTSVGQMEDVIQRLESLSIKCDVGVEKIKVDFKKAMRNKRAKTEGLNEG